MRLFALFLFILIMIFFVLQSFKHLYFFQSNEYKDVGQRALLSVPRNQSSKTVGAYRRCMFRRGYLLRAM